jgi:DNA repair exonuclease SbcCD ATPase subunit
MNLDELKAAVEQERGKSNRLKAEYEKLTKTFVKLDKYLREIEQARVIIQTVAQLTQSQLEYFVSDIVSLALESVLDDPYQFRTEFVMRRGKTECNLWFERDENRLRPLDASGGGAVDIASFALRLSLWSLNKNRPTIVLDEPFKHLSKDLHPKALQMLKAVAQKLKLQIIVVTHSEDLMEDADKIFEVKKVGKISQVTGRESA